MQLYNSVIVGNNFEPVVLGIWSQVMELNNNVKKYKYGFWSTIHNTTWKTSS